MHDRELKKTVTFLQFYNSELEYMPDGNPNFPNCNGKKYPTTRRIAIKIQNNHATYYCFELNFYDERQPGRHLGTEGLSDGLVRPHGDIGRTCKLIEREDWMGLEFAVKRSGTVRAFR